MTLSKRLRGLPWPRTIVLLSFGVCLAMASVHSVVAQDEQSETSTAEAKPAKSAVRGRVTFADSGQPLRRATLRLRKDFNRNFLMRTISGRNGEFVFQGVPAGTYYIDVEAAGIVSLSSGASFSNLGFSIDESMLQQITVDGSNDVKAEVRVTRGAAISGRVSYGDGEPATHARIMLYRQKGQASVPFFMDAPAFSDDRGVYRVEGLPSGNYFVGAVENNWGEEKTFPRDGPGMVTAYHPDALSVRAATMISVPAGGEAREANIKFDAVPRRVAGRLKWKQGDVPIEHASVFLRRIDDPQMDLDQDQFEEMLMPSSNVDSVDLMMQDMFYLSLVTANSPYVQSDESGHWSFENVSPGNYVVSVEAPIPVEKPATTVKPNEDEPAMFKDLPDLPEPPDFANGIIRGSAEVTLKDDDIDDLIIDLSAGGSIAGSVVIEGKSSDATGVAVKAIVEGTQPLLNLPAHVKPDNTFVLRSVKAGNVRLDVPQARGTRYYIRSITGKGLDLLKEAMPLIEGEQVTGVRIVLATDLATIDGRVVATGDGRGVPGAGVALFPVDQRRWSVRSTSGLARADAEGRFSMKLAPGDYLAVAWSVANEPTISLDAYVRENSRTARRITLKPNETRALEIQTAVPEKD